MTSRRSNSVEVRIFGDISDISKKLKTLESQTQGFASKLSSAGTTLTRNLTVPLAGLGAVAVKAASSLGESVNAVNVVFGEAADKIHDFGKTSAEAVGLSTRAFNQLVVPLGSVFQNFGDSADEAARKSIELTQRAADMASVFDVDVTEALQAIQAALRGEADPIERFGVSVNAAAVEAKALALGLAETKSQITDADKATARYALILEQTQRVAGDFANTSDSLANRTRSVKSAAEDVAAQLGSVMLPVLEQVVGVVGDATESFANLNPETQETVVQVALLAAAAGPAAAGLGAIGKAAAGAATSIKALNLIVASLGGKAAALKALAGSFVGIAGVMLATEAAGNKLANTLAQKLDPGFGELNVQIEDVLSPGRWPRFIQALRDAAEGAEDTAQSVGRYRNEQEQQIFLTRLQAQEQEELNRVFSRFRTPGEIPPPDTAAFEGRIARASEVVQNFARQQLALADPVLARVLAEQRAADAQDRYAEVTKDAESSERDRERAALDLLVAEAELDAAHKDLADTIDGSVLGALDALLERTGLLREDYRFLTELVREFNTTLGQQGVFVTSDGRPINVRDLNRELVRRNQQVVE